MENFRSIPYTVLDAIMLLETLVLSSCLGGYECNLTPRAYYLTNPKLRSWVKESSQDLKQFPYSETVLPVVAGFILLTSGSRVTIKITKNLSLRLRDDSTELRLTYAF